MAGKSEQLAAFLPRLRKGDKKTSSRQQSGQSDKMLATLPSKENPTNPIEPLPIVELKPFVPKEWRPSNSIPEHERVSMVLSRQTPRSEKSSSSVDFESSGFPSPDRVGAQRNFKEHGSKPNTRQGEREKTIIKQSLPREKEGQYSAEQHRQGFVQGFATKLDRENTTHDELRHGTNLNLYFNNTQRKGGLTDEDFFRQGGIKIDGQRMNHMPPTRSMIYADPWQTYRRNEEPREVTMTNGEHAKKNENGKADTTSLLIRLDNLQNMYGDTVIYDTFDRSNTLPSINVGNAPMKRRRVPPKNGNKPPRSGAVTPQTSYQLGVTNSLDLLSHYGQPVKIEKHLTLHLKQTIVTLKKQKFKNHLSGGPIFIPQYEYSPTQGELSLRKALDGNRSTKTANSSPEQNPSFRTGSKLRRQGSRLGRPGAYTGDLPTRSVSPTKSNRSMPLLDSSSQRSGIFGLQRSQSNLSRRFKGPRDLATESVRTDNVDNPSEADSSIPATRRMDEVLQEEDQEEVIDDFKDDTSEVNGVDPGTNEMQTSPLSNQPVEFKDDSSHTSGKVPHKSIEVKVPSLTRNHSDDYSSLSLMKSTSATTLEKDVVEMDRDESGDTWASKTVTNCRIPSDTPKISVANSRKTEPDNALGLGKDENENVKVENGTNGAPYFYITEGSDLYDDRPSTQQRAS